MSNLTHKNLNVLAYIYQRRPNVYAIAREFEMRGSTASQMINRLRDGGLIYDWERYGERLHITPDGMFALTEEDGVRKPATPTVNVRSPSK